jgi:hypothetical protein
VLLGRLVAGVNIVTRPSYLFLVAGWGARWTRWPLRRSVTCYEHVMNFSIHLDEATAGRLAKEASRQGRARNALITEAIKAWLEARRHTEWPLELLEFEGAPALEPFEASRPPAKGRRRFP